MITRFTEEEYTYAEALFEQINKEFSNNIDDLEFFLIRIDKDYIPDLTLTLLHKYKITEKFLTAEELKRIYALIIMKIKGWI